jgi:hypothetical protein
MIRSGRFAVAIIVTRAAAIVPLALPAGAVTGSAATGAPIRAGIGASVIAIAP